MMQMLQGLRVVALDRKGCGIYEEVDPELAEAVTAKV
jgi:hypothetical protein